jgi:hypothetical protein
MVECGGSFFSAVSTETAETVFKCLAELTLGGAFIKALEIEH